LKLRNTVVKDDGGFHIRKIILSVPKGLFSLAYLYKDGKHFLTRIEMLPRDWTVNLPSGISTSEHCISVNTRDAGIIYVFDVNNPVIGMATE